MPNITPRLSNCRSGWPLLISLLVIPWLFVLVAAAQPLYRTGTSAVVVDVVVHDSKGRSVGNLTEADFELFEDGVKHDGVRVTFVRQDQPSTGSSHAEASASSISDPRAQLPSVASIPSVTAMIFDRLSPEARDLAYRSALKYVDGMSAGEWMAIFAADLGLTTIQPYTDSRDKVRAGLSVIATRATTSVDHERSEAHVPATVGAEFAGAALGVTGGFVGSTVERLSQASRNSFERLTREQQGLASTNALIAVAAALGTLPGRKSILYFAEEIAVPDAVLPHFSNVIATANRGNVTIYAIDPAGLRVHSAAAETARDVNALGKSALKLNPDGSNANSLSMLERNEDVLRKGARTSLRLLAEPTGGFVVGETNDLSAGLESIRRDSRSYYLLTYIPQNTAFDGEWRRIRVKVLRSNLSVRAKSGYIATPTPIGAPVLEYEAPLLAALTGPSGLSASHQAAALIFPASKRATVALFVWSNTGILTFSQAPDEKKRRAVAAILARLRNSQNEVVFSASQPYTVVEASTTDGSSTPPDIVFSRYTTLQPGSYAFDTVVRDALSKRAETTTRQFLVANSDTLDGRTSSLVLVERGERLVSDGTAPDDPLVIGNIRLHPNMGRPIAPSDRVLLYFTIADTPTTPIRATLVVLSGERTVLQVVVQMDEPDAAAVTRQLIQLPLTQLTTGDYIVRLHLASGSQHVSRDVTLKVK